MVFIFQKTFKLQIVNIYHTLVEFSDIAYHDEEIKNNINNNNSNNNDQKPINENRKF